MPAWHLLESNAADAAFNMALDEALLVTAARRRVPLLRVYRWTQPAASFGYFQKYPAHLAATRQLVRRPTGGGLVYHGADTTYTVVAPPDDPLAALRTTEAYRLLHQAVAAALPQVAARVSAWPAVSPGCARVSDPAREADRRSPSPSASAPVASRRYECFLNPVPGDVVVDGRKLAGGAQRRSKRGLLHQGSIAATVTAAQLADGFRQQLAAEFQAYRLTPEELALAETLARDKYATDAWNQRVL